MRFRFFHIVVVAAMLAGCGGSRESSAPRANAPALRIAMPWGGSGLTEREAAAHLLNRFTFGPRPGDVDEVISKGLEHWFADQLRGDLPDPEMDARLASLPALRLTGDEIAATYPPPGQIVLLAKSEGFIPSLGEQYTDTLGRPRREYAE